MPSRPQAILRLLANETDLTKSKMESVRSKSLRRAQRLRRLTKRQTDAFVELSQHYLPNLSRNSLRDSWSEVKQQIQDLLLQKEDRHRTIRAELNELQFRREELEQEREVIREQLERERVVLSCKTGNYKKMMREDPEIVRLLKQIDRIDTEIESGIKALEHAKTDAEEKLPSYERSSLFSYLQNCQFGTESYGATGIQKRWDRWLAKLIDFDDAKRGFDHLVQTPEKLRRLISDKQDFYRRLLEELEAARDKATRKFGVAEQTKSWKRLKGQVGALDESIEQAAWAEACLVDDLYTIENLNGVYYDDAINIYSDFLAKLRPDILKVYAECTDSPVDDEICARIRHIEDDISKQKMHTRRRDDRLERLERYNAGLLELSDRLRSYLQHSPSDIEFADELCLGDLLHRMKLHKQTPTGVWRLIRESMIPPNQSTDGQPISILDAAFFASSSHLDDRTDTAELDPSGIVLLPIDRTAHNGAGSDPSESEGQNEYAAVAICHSEVEAHGVRHALENRVIDCFICVPELGQPNCGRFSPDPNSGIEIAEGPDDLQVMVKVKDLAIAYQTLKELQSNYEKPWICKECRSEIDRGYSVCHHCGAHKPKERL